VSELLSDCSLLELLLLTSFHRLMLADAPEPHNFTAAMREYDAFVGSDSASSSNSGLRFPRAAMLKGLEALVSLSLVHVRGARARAQLSHVPARLAVSAEEVREFVRAKSDCPLLVQRWACNFVDAVVN
ncbi:hypothetical protein T492DRAFT_863773, partial [Pavlovales sp. CCMP2436]